MWQHVCNINESRMISSNILFNPFDKGEQICLLFTCVLLRLCFPCVGDVFFVQSGSVLMNHCLFLCLCLFLVWDYRGWIQYTKAECTALTRHSLVPYKSTQPVIFGFQILILCFAAIWLVYIRKNGPVTNRSHLLKPLIKIMLLVSCYSVFDCVLQFAFLLFCLYKGMLVFELV